MGYMCLCQFWFPQGIWIEVGLLDHMVFLLLVFKGISIPFPVVAVSVYIPTNGASSVQFSSVSKLCLTLCDPMNCSMPGFPVLHSLPVFAQTHVHWVSDAIQPSHPLSSPSLAFNLASIRVFSNEAAGGQSIGASASASILPMNIQDWFLLGLTGLISLQSKGLLRVFSNTIFQKHQFFTAQLSLCPTLTPIHDYWKNHSFD